MLVCEDGHVGAVGYRVSSLGILRLKHVLEVDTEEDLQVTCDEGKIHGRSHWLGWVVRDIEGFC